MEQIQQQKQPQLPLLPPSSSQLFGKPIAKDWLKSKSPQVYRAHLHSAFEKAQLNYQLRKKDPRVNHIALQQQVKELETSNTYDKARPFQDQLEEYSEIDPQMPNMGMDRLKLIKLSRSCSKNMLERYFTLNQESFVYYKKEQDAKPKKAVSLDECRIKVESKEDYKAKQGQAQQQSEEEKLSQWTEIDKGFRLSIRLKSRKFQPAYYYTESKHQATCIKTMIEQILAPQNAKVKSQILQLLDSIYQITNFKAFYTRILRIRQKRIQHQKFYQSIHVLASNFEVERKDKVLYIDKEVKRMKEIEYQEYLKQQQAEQSDEEEILPPEPEKIPEIYPTFRRGQINFRDYFHFKIYSKVQRHLKNLAKFIRERKNQRHPVIQDLITKKLDIKQFPCSNGVYRIHDGILENMNKIGDIPYLISDVNGIAAVKVEGENLIIIDKKSMIIYQQLIIGHEYNIPLNEICYICTDIGFQQENKEKSWKLQLRGRKINANVEMIGENILSQQIGLERVKYSRLVEKSCLKFSLKKIQIPLFIQDQIKSYLVNPKDKVNFRLKFEIGEFYCYSTFFTGTSFSTIELKEDMAVDIHEAKHMKVTLLAVKGRPSPNSQLVNEFVNEQIVSFVSLRMRDFENEGGEMLHTITFNKQFYSPKESNQSPQKVDNIVLTAAFVIVQLNGAYPSVEMEGPQFLIGRYAIYKRQIVVKILRVNRNHTATIQLLEGQPLYDKFPQKQLDNISIKQELTPFERYGISILSILNQPQNFQSGQYEWSLDLILNQNEKQLLQKIQEGIAQSQLKQIYQQRLIGYSKKQKSQAFVCGRLYLSIMNAQNLANQDKTLCDSFVQVSIQDTKNQSNAKFIDIANEQSFIMCKKNSEDIVNKTYKTTLVKQNNNPQWVSSQNPQGETFDLGMFMKKYPHFILIEVYHQKKKSRFSSEMVSEMIGFAELATEDLLSLDNYGQEFYMFLEDSLNRSSLIKIRSLFVPSFGTIERLNLDTTKCLFKNAQQFLFFKVLHLHNLYDDYGYQVPLGRYLADFNSSDTLAAILSLTAGGASKDQINQSLIQEAQTFTKRYERFSPEHKKHRHLQELNPHRPKLEENAFLFKQIWLYTQFVHRNQALIERQRVFWEEFMTDLMKTADDEGFVDDELKSIRSKLTNTTKMISTKYRKRGTRQMRAGQDNQGSGSIKDGQDSASQQKGSKFSVIFVGQWEKEQNWKYIDIWYLVKFGIPEDLRVSLWKDLLRRQINEQQVYVYFKRSQDYGEIYNANISNYDNLKIFAGMRDSTFYQQIENDIKDFQFLKGYLKNQNSIREDRQEEERLCMLNIFKAYSLWALEFCKRRQKILSINLFLNFITLLIVYNSGLLHIVQRLLTIMNEEDAFWTLIGMSKAFANVFIFDYKPPNLEPASQYELFTPLISRRVAFKNEMTILQCLLKLHYPLVYNHLRSLSMPLEYYFYTPFSRFFTSGCFSSEIVLRLWDMLVFNLSTNSLENRKRALWYLLAVPLYMVQVNQDTILKTYNPKIIKQLLLKKTGSINYNPNIFIEELLLIIKQVFVKKDTMVNKILKNDKAHQLENLRIDVEIEIQKRLKDSQEQDKKIARYSADRGGMEITVRKTPQASVIQQQQIQQQQIVQVKVSLVGIRNVLEPQIEPVEIVDMILVISGADEGDVQSKPFQAQVPMTNEQALLQTLQDPFPTVITNLVYKENKKLTLQLLLHPQGQILGKCSFSLDDYISTSFEQFLSLKFSQDRNAYLDLKLIFSKIPQPSQVKPQPNSITALLTLSGIPHDEMDMDLYFKERDEEIKSNIKKEVIKENILKKAWLNAQGQSQNQYQSMNIMKEIISNIGVNEEYYKKLETENDDDEQIQQKQQTLELEYVVKGEDRFAQMIQCLSGGQRVIQELDIDKSTNYSQLAIKLLMLSGTNDTVNNLFTKIFDLLKNPNNKIIHQSLQLLVWHLYTAIFYPMPYNEVKTITQTYLTHNYCGIVKVTQQQSLESFMQNQNIFNKLFTKNQQPVLTSFDVTEQFLSVLNSVMRVTGLIDHIDFSVEPFNNISFWLRQTNNLKKLDQTLTLTLSLPNGDFLNYPYTLDAQGNFPATCPVLPLHLNGHPSLTHSQTLTFLNKLPLLSNLLRQDLFLRDQLFPSQEVYVDSPHPFKILFTSLNNKKFVFNFTPDVDKQEDFTVDQQQLMRIAKGDISRVYNKIEVVDEKGSVGSNGFQVWLSAISRQDTFIMIKNRMRLALEFISENENLRDSNAVPNVMSEKFQFKRPQDAAGNYFNSMDRVMNITAQKELEFELVRVQVKLENDPQYIKEQYSSYAIYTHPNGVKEWRACKIQMKVPSAANSSSKHVRYEDMANYRVEFWHERDTKTSYVFPREDILLSFAYKRTQENYYREEIQEFLDKLDQEEVEIAELIKEQDKRQGGGAQGIDEVKKQLNYGNSGEEGLKIGNKEIEEEDKDEEMREIRDLQLDLEISQISE